MANSLINVKCHSQSSSEMNKFDLDTSIDKLDIINIFKYRNLMDIMVSIIGGDVFYYTFYHLFNKIEPSKKYLIHLDRRLNLDQRKLLNSIIDGKRQWSEMDINLAFNLIKNSCGLESDCHLLDLLLRYKNIANCIAQTSELTEKEFNEMKKEHTTILDAILVAVGKTANIDNDKMKIKIESQTEHLCYYYLKIKKVIEELTNEMLKIMIKEGTKPLVQTTLDVIFPRFRGLLYELRSFLVDKLKIKFEEVEKYAPLEKLYRYKCMQDLIFLKCYEK